jgi:hypothetical protein
MPLAQSIGLDTLSKYFHLPINDVAKELGVCATVLKKICRKNGIPRWPHRKIKSLDKMIATLDASVAKNPEDEARIRQEIQTLKNKRTFLMKNPNVLATKPGGVKKGLKPLSKSTKLSYLDNTKVSNTSFSDEPLAATRDLNSMTTALYSQLSHPHILQASPPVADMVPHHIAPTPSQWNIGIDSYENSAFLTPKMLRRKQQQLLQHRKVLQQQYESLTDSHYSGSTLVPSPTLSPPPESANTQEDSHVPHITHQPHSMDFPIHLPELRLPATDGEIHKLSTLEPEMFHSSTSTSSPPVPRSSEQGPSSHSRDPAYNSSSVTIVSPITSFHSKWVLPEWFEDEQKQARKMQDRNRVSQSGNIKSEPSTILLYF